MEKVKKEINQITFEYDREERALKAIEEIYRLVSSRDYGSINVMNKSKLGKAFIDIAEVYGEHAPCCRSNFRERIKN